MQPDFPHRLLKPGTGTNGFSLVELAVVIVIVGLLIGAVTVGKSMIRSARLQSVMSDADRYVKAMRQFQEKYTALPGDLASATSFWGTDAGGCPATPYNTVTKKATCNGDGNGTIGTPGTAATYVEWLRAWQHLANAGMISGSFTGAQGASGNTDTVIGLNVPDTQITGAGFSISRLSGANNSGIVTGNASWYDANYGHVLLFGAKETNSFTSGAAITTMEALDIDIKMDDGRPGTGKVLSAKRGNASAPNCATTAVESTAAYDPSLSNNACMLVFITGL